MESLGLIFEYITPLPIFFNANIFPSGEIIAVWPNVSLLGVFFPVWAGANI